MMRMLIQILDINRKDFLMNDFIQNKLKMTLIIGKLRDK